jgi:protein arginine N-methyltransferase 1
VSDSTSAEHSGYLADERKLEAYENALTHLLAGQSKSVLDLGAGSGILGLLAARAGARRVYAVDSGSIIGPAAEVAEASGFGDTIVHLRGSSTEIDLPERVDVAVCDQIGGFVHDAGVLEYFADVRGRLLVDGGTLVPAAFELVVAPACCDPLREQLDTWSARVRGFDFSVFAEAAVNTEHRIGGDDVVPLAPGAVLAEIAADHVAAIEGTARVEIESPGECDGIVGWFRADLGGGVSLTNEPGSPTRMDRWCNVYPITERVSLQPGDVVVCEVDLRPLLHAVTWRVTVARQGSELVDERHSTLLGTFLSAEDLRREGGQPVTATTSGRALAVALGLADGTRSVDQIVVEVQSELGPFVTPALEGRLRDLLARHTTVE